MTLGPLTSWEIPDEMTIEYRGPVERVELIRGLMKEVEALWDLVRDLAKEKVEQYETCPFHTVDMLYRYREMAQKIVAAMVAEKMR